MKDFTILNGSSFRELLKHAYNRLKNDSDLINDLNVFPVPDGDTGTNMRLTFLSGLKNLKPTDSLSDVASSFATGMLYGARGNSGVLSSRYFNGLAKGLTGKESASVFDFALAMVSAYQVAYVAVAQPTEGTILTVAREGIESIRNQVDYKSITFASFFGLVVDSMKLSLDRTPDLLPVLKEAGVVDSGGRGLLSIFQGFLSVFNEGTITDEDATYEETPLPTDNLDFSLFNENSALDYGYCTEFLLQLLSSKTKVADFDLHAFEDWMKEHGTSLVCFENGTVVKVHIHTKKPWEVIQYAENYGEFLTFKMENMALQHNGVEKKKKIKALAKKKFALVAIGQGKGVLDTFKSLGADVVLDGGSTMNTSSAELIEAFEKANAEDILVLPDEKNIWMAADQAAALYKESRVRILKTKSIPAGFACLQMVVGGQEDAESCYQSMEEENEWVKTGFVSKATRDTVLDGVPIRKGGYLASVEGKAVFCGKDLTEAFLKLLAGVDGIRDKETVFFFYGKNVSSEQADLLVKKVQSEYPNLEVGSIDGVQDVYDLLVGIN